MKTVEEIERKSTIRIADEKQKQILEESIVGEVSQKQVEDWNFFVSLMEKLKNENY